jgi:integration host factor subunit alpha
MALTKDDLMNAIHKKLGFPKSKSVRLVESLLETVKIKLEQGEDVLISRFGKFCVKNKNARRGRNPATGEDLMLGSKRIVTFKCSPVLRDKVNGGD